MKTKYDFLEYLNDECIGLEHGVGNGIGTEKILMSGKFSYVYSIDSYDSNTHDYKQSLIKLDKYKEKHSLFRMKHMFALDMFPDHFFNIMILNVQINDVIGKWLPKMKSDGIILGDYVGSEAEFIEQFCKEYRFVLHTIGSIWFIKLNETESFAKMMGMLEL